MESRFLKTHIFAIFALFLCSGSKASDLPGSTDIGDHLRFTADVYGFVPILTAPGADVSPTCVGMDTTYVKRSVSSTETIVEFLNVVPPQNSAVCGLAPKLPVINGTYKISNTQLSQATSKTTGVAFGALVVPFKFRLGNDKKLTASSTIAPFIGARWDGLQGFGMEGMPVLAAGLGMVPVTNPTTHTTETKSAYSTAAGFTLTSVKNSSFSAGILVGKDFLSKSDQAGDPSVGKLWISIWLGISK